MFSLKFQQRIENPWAHLWVLKHEFSLNHPKFSDLLRRLASHPTTAMICLRSHRHSTVHDVLPWTSVLDVNTPSGRFYYYISPGVRYGSAPSIWTDVLFFFLLDFWTCWVALLPLSCFLVLRTLVVLVLCASNLTGCVVVHECFWLGPAVLLCTSYTSSWSCDEGLSVCTDSCSMWLVRQPKKKPGLPCLNGTGLRSRTDCEKMSSIFVFEGVSCIFGFVF